MTERIKWADRARGLGILLIYSVHIVGMGLGKDSLVVQLLSMSCLGMFYFTSGYFCNCRFKLKHWLKHHTYTLLLPYLIASLAFWVSHFIQRDPGSVDRFLGIFLQLPNTPWEGGRWFIPSFFLAKLIFDFTASRCNNHRKLWLISIGYAATAWIYTLMNGPRLPWNMEAALFAQPFFAMGFTWKHTLEQRYAALSRSRKAGIIFAATTAGMLLAVVNLWLGGRNIDYHTRELNEFFSAYGASSCALFLILQLCKVRSGLLEFIGRNSLTYCLYGALVAAVMSRITGFVGVSNWIAEYVIGIIGLAYLGVPISLVLNRYSPWAIGKRRLRKSSTTIE